MGGGEPPLSRRRFVGGSLASLAVSGCGASSHVAPTLRGEPHEALLLLRWADSATSARGYECLFSFDGGFDIVRWNGPYGDFTSIGQEDARLGRTLATGDVLRARIVGPAITCFVNDAQVGHTTDATSRGRQPGSGFFRRA